MPDNVVVILKLASRIIQTRDGSEERRFEPGSDGGALWPILNHQTQYHHVCVMYPWEKLYLYMWYLYKCMWQSKILVLAIPDSFSTISMSDRVTTNRLEWQATSYKRSHMEAKSINILLRYDPKCNPPHLALGLWLVVHEYTAAP